MRSKLDFSTILFDQFGPLIGGVDLVKILGFRTSSAFSKSLRERRIGIDIFDIPGRKGKFAYSEDVATWLSQVGIESK
jgi:hypothetical protein